MILHGVKDKKGIRYCLKDVISRDWRSIGLAIGIKLIRLDEIRDDKSRYQNNDERLGEVVRLWEQDKQEKYEFTIKGLCNLLRDCEHGVAAKVFEGLQ